MSLRQFYRIVKGFNKRREYDRQLCYQVAALQVAEIVNIVGATNSEGKWQYKQPQFFLDAWNGKTNDVEAAKERIARANERHEARLLREAARRKKRGVDSSP